MNYRAPAADTRLYLCPGCSTPQPAPPQGGQVVCAQCRAPFVLPDRGAAFVGDAPGPLRVPRNDPERLQALRVQDGRPRTTSPALQSVLGGPGVQPGREQEALAIWQSLRARSTQGDVAASEDLATLTLLLVSPAHVPEPLLEALSESTVDAAALPRHKVEQLGRLARRAVAAGNRAKAARLLSMMPVDPPDIDSDSEYRLSCAVLATLDGDAQRVLALLGPRKDAVPLVDTMDPLASVFRANAFERLGDGAQAAQVLTELPAPEVLDAVRARFPALPLCAQTGARFKETAAQQGAQRASSSAGRVGTMVGGVLLAVGVVEVVVAVSVGAATGGVTNPAVLVNGLVGVGLAIAGAKVALGARAAGQRAAWLRVNGIPLRARIVGLEPTGTRINNVPMVRFRLQVAGPRGPYEASFKRLVQPFEAGQLIGQEVRVRANPQKLDELVLEE